MERATMDHLEQTGEGADLEAIFVKDFLIAELGLQLGIDFSFTSDEMLLNQKSFQAMLAAIPEEDAQELIMTVKLVD
jgi:beta-mannanase